MPKPRIKQKCPADIFSGPNEKVIEFTFPGTEGDVYEQGGLIAFQIIDGVGYVDVYQCDSQVVVNGERQKGSGQHTYKRGQNG